ncbi:MAG: hypothetical protein ACI4O9_08065 [Akkermansia sp.]
MSTTTETTKTGMWYSFHCTAAATVTAAIDGETINVCTLDDSGSTIFCAPDKSITITTNGKYRVLPTKAPAIIIKTDGGGTSSSDLSAHAATMATLTTYGHVKKSSSTGTSLPVIGVSDAGQMVLNVRTSHSGLEVSNGLYIQTSTETHPTEGDSTTPLIGTNSAGKLVGLCATSDQAGGVLLASGLDDSRTAAVPTAAQVQSALAEIIARISALES